MPLLNPHLRDTATPPIPLAQGWAKSYEGEAGPLIDLSQAVPGYPAHPELLRRLAFSAGQAEKASYGPIEGDSLLREAYATHVSEVYAAQVEAPEVAITTGCNQAFFVASIAVARAGENILLPSPWYFNHKMTLDMLGIEARPLRCDPLAGFIPDAAEAEALVDARTRAIVLVTPNNPTGAVYPPQTIAAFADLCQRRGLTLIIDETYRDFIAGRPHGLFGEAALRPNVIALYSFSKAYCIPGHRLGAMVAPPPMLAEISKILDTLQICAPRVAQEPIAWAIPALEVWRYANRAEIERRAAAFRIALAGVAGWRIDSLGSYFAFLHHPFAERKSADVVRDLVQKRGVLTLPGPWFGPHQEHHMRVAFANAEVSALTALRERFAGFGM